MLAAASKAMGMDNLTSITIYGSGANFNLGQRNNANDQWPRNNLSDYQRSIDFGTSTSRATAVTFAAPVTGGPPVQGAFQQNITANNTAWAQQLEIWTTPWGFVKGAMANNATLSSSGRQQGPHVDDDAEGAVGRVVQSRRLRQRAEHGDARRHVARESDLRRHARRERLQQLPRRRSAA